MGLKNEENVVVGAARQGRLSVLSLMDIDTTNELPTTIASELGWKVQRAN